MRKFLQVFGFISGEDAQNRISDLITKYDIKRQAENNTAVKVVYDAIIADLYDTLRKL